jgi:hypothetical protein
MIARERPDDPVKHLGLFLINYKKWNLIFYIFIIHT